MFQNYKAHKAVCCSLILFFWIYLNNRFLNLSQRDLKFWSLAYLEEEESGWGKVGQDKEDSSQTFDILFH